MKKKLTLIGLLLFFNISAQNNNEMKLKLDFINGVKHDSVNKIVNDDAINIYATTKYKKYYYFFGQNKAEEKEIYYRKVIIYLVKDNKVLSSVKTKYPYYEIFFANLKQQQFKGVDDAFTLVDNAEYSTFYGVIFRLGDKLINVFETQETYEEYDYKKIKLDVPNNQPNQLWVTKTQKGYIRKEYDGEKQETTYYTNTKKYSFNGVKLVLENKPLRKYYYVTAFNGLYARDAPSVFSNTIRKIPFGTKLEILNKTELMFTMGNGTELLKGNWVEVADNDNTIYYVFDGFLSEIPPEKDKKEITYANASINKTGKWKWYYWDGTINEEGYYKNGEKDGEWKWYYKDGTLRTHGFYKNGKATGTRKWYHNDRLATTGQYIDGKKTGKWKWYFPNKQLQFVLSFENDLVLAYTVYKKNGAIITEYQTGIAEEFVLEEAYNMEIVWLMSDRQSLKFNSKQLLFGEIKNGNKIGLWKYYDFDDNYYYELRKYTGDDNLLLKKYYKQGKLKSLVHYTRNDLNGKADYYYENGQIKRSSYFINGKREGILKRYFKNGNLRYDLNYKNGLADGVHKEYYENGVLERIMNYSNGKKDNKQQYFYENGTIKKLVYYNKGIKKVQEKNYYENGNLMRIAALSKGNDSLIFIKRYREDKTLQAEYYMTLKNKRTGVHKYFYDNGNIEKVTNYQDGKEEGSYTYYYRNGNISSTGTNVANKRVGVVTFYNENGTLRRKEYEEPDSSYVRTLAEWTYYPAGQLESKKTYEAKSTTPIIDAKTSTWNYYDNGQLLMEKVEADDKLIKWNYYYKNGELREVITQQEYGKRKYIKYHKNGKVYTTKIKNSGKLIEVAIPKDKNGNLLARGTFKNGNGTVNEYTSDGILLNTVLYADGLISDNSFSIESIWLNTDELNSRAWEAYEKEEDIEKLKQATLWVKQAIIINKNYFNTDTYAALLYKTGSYKKALKIANKAIKIAKKTNEDYKATESLIKSIEEKL